MDEAWLNTVRLARDCGNVSSLFPPGIASVWDLPHTMHTAIRMALYFLSFEELPQKEQPPKKYWLDPDKMKLWWQEVKANREAELKGEGAVKDMPQNQYAADLMAQLKRRT